MSPAQVVAVEFRDEKVLLTLADGRIFGAPLAWYPWLETASAPSRQDYEMHQMAVYWPTLDDGIDAEEMLKGEPPNTARLRVQP
jgi:hypothetical protein